MYSTVQGSMGEKGVLNYRRLTAQGLDVGAKACGGLVPHWADALRREGRKGRTLVVRPRPTNAILIYFDPGISLVANV
ncbi:hypothetical protein R1flu_020897 [Riccia fluitans]|uniref:Uncharacterized protein n=1 Tax=Riccia fluitans TaxID=41844 RepID=A0ABD1ZMU0_9MARC